MSPLGCGFILPVSLYKMQGHFFSLVWAFQVLFTQRQKSVVHQWWAIGSSGFGMSLDLLFTFFCPANLQKSRKTKKDSCLQVHIVYDPDLFMAILYYSGYSHAINLTVPLTPLILYP